MLDLAFYAGKSILITGHTGFKGTWLTRILVNAGANVIGYSRCSAKEVSFFEASTIKNRIVHIQGDVRDLNHLKKVFEEYHPEIVFHLAAQPIVRYSYMDPVYTYETNVLGTVNIMECVRLSPCVRSVINVTTDKVYYNNEWYWGYRENEHLDGYDPYSNSKSCSELVTNTYVRSFFQSRDIAVSTARAGNVIGGGDFSADRIMPDCIRAVVAGNKIEVRNPYSIRPYQHVFEALAAYLEIAEKQYIDIKYQGSYNIGPDECDCVATGDLVSLFCKYWGENASWESREALDAVHEAQYLKLDCSKIKTIFGWRPKWHIEKCIEMVCQFSKAWISGEDIPKEMDREIEEYFVYI